MPRWMDARLKVSRRFRDVLASIATDLGGADRLSEGQKQIPRRCAMTPAAPAVNEQLSAIGLLAAPFRRARDHLAERLPVPNCSHNKSALSGYR
jgi:hypothetical protein